LSRYKLNEDRQYLMNHNLLFFLPFQNWKIKISVEPDGAYFDPDEIAYVLGCPIESLRVSDGKVSGEAVVAASLTCGKAGAEFRAWLQKKIRLSKMRIYKEHIDSGLLAYMFEPVKNRDGDVIAIKEEVGGYAKGTG
jgi:hypothetical protein